MRHCRIWPVRPQRRDLGYKFFDSPDTKLSAQLGVGYRSLRPELLIKDSRGAVIDRIALQSEAEAVGTAGVHNDAEPRVRIPRADIASALPRCVHLRPR